MEAEAVSNTSCFKTVYRVIKELTDGRKSFDGLVGNLNRKFVLAISDTEVYKTILSAGLSGARPTQ